MLDSGLAVAVVVAGLENREKPEVCVCVCGWAAGAALAKSEGVVVAVDFAAPRVPPNKLLVGCVVLDCAVEDAGPRSLNKLGAEALVVLAGAPKSPPPVDGPLEAGRWVLRLLNSDIAVVGCGCAVVMVDKTNDWRAWTGVANNLDHISIYPCPG